MASSPAILRVEAGRTVLACSEDGGSSGFVALERSAVTRPFLKWTGGKQWLAAVAPALIGADVSARYFEPFVGGGSVFFALGVSRATLGDACEELIDAYRGVRDVPEKVIAALRTYPHDRAFFERIRRVTPRTSHTKAARLIYLNKTAFNGMYRVNLKGDFNVPFGRYVNPTICDSERILAAAHALAGVRLIAGDFEATTKTARAGDVVYLDPPYITGHRNNGFLKYNAPLFSWEDQQRLARMAVRLRKRGVTVIVSNSDHLDVIALYEGFYRYVVSRNSLIGGAGSQRGAVREALLTSTPLVGVATGRI